MKGYCVYVIFLGMKTEYSFFLRNIYIYLFILKKLNEYIKIFVNFKQFFFKRN